MSYQTTTTSTVNKYSESLNAKPHVAALVRDASIRTGLSMTTITSAILEAVLEPINDKRDRDAYLENLMDNTLELTV